MVTRPGPVSPEIAAAQEQLALRRQQHRQERIARQRPVQTDAHGRLPSSTTGAPPPPVAAKPTAVPSDTVGWESVSLSRALEAARRQREQRQARAAAQELAWLPATPQPPSMPQSRERRQLPSHTHLYPDLALAMLQQQEVATARIWLLLRYLDQEGRGWITVAQARAQLTGKRSELRVCGWRQLRNLLAEGEGLFWTRDPQPVAEGRIWLRSLARVARSFGVTRFSLRPVALPVKILTETIGTVRAHFYASFHSGRRHRHPIARETLADISNVSRRTQRTYEEKAGVKPDTNWVIGPRYTPQAAQEQAWQRGAALFTFTDHAGTYGRSGQRYLAWQLPNSYAGPHTPLSRGHQKQINRKLADLFMKGITGNGEQEVEPQSALPERRQPARFCANGEEAVRVSTRGPATEHYWQTHRRHRQVRIWHLLPGETQC